MRTKKEHDLPLSNSSHPKPQTMNWEGSIFWVPAEVEDAQEVTVIYLLLFQLFEAVVLT